MRPFFPDLRERIPPMELGGHTLRKWAELFVVVRIQQRTRQVDSIAPKPKGGGWQPKLTRRRWRISEKSFTDNSMPHWPSGGTAWELPLVCRPYITHSDVSYITRKKILHTNEWDMRRVQATPGRFAANLRDVDP